MKLDRVTITGADDSVRPQNLADLTKAFPFVEWGILASAKAGVIGSPRFPSQKWIEELRGMVIEMSLHLCGRWVRQLLVGAVDPTIVHMTKGFDRVQLNFHAEKSPCDAAKAMEALCAIRGSHAYGSDLQFLFQLDGATGNEHLESITSHYVDAYGEPSNFFGLFDMSGGAGVLPAEWPTPMYSADGVPDYCGYAGGLGPDNLAEQLPLIAKAAGDCRIWIDMETKVRSDDDRQFDLAKVRKCLEIAVPYVEKQ